MVELTQEQAELLAQVKEFNIRTRYDDYKKSFYKKATAAYAKKYITEVHDFKTWLKKQ